MTVNRKYVAVALVLLLQLADVITTHVGLRRGKREANPFMAFVVSKQSESFAFVFKLSVMILLCLDAINHNRSLAVAAGVSAFPVANNIVRLFEDN